MADENPKSFRRKRILRDEWNENDENNISEYPVDFHNDTNFVPKMNYILHSSTLMNYGASTSNAQASSPQPSRFEPRSSTPLSLSTDAIARGSADSNCFVQKQLSHIVIPQSIVNNSSNNSPHSDSQNSASNPSTLDYGAQATYSNKNSTRTLNTVGRRTSNCPTINPSENRNIVRNSTNNARPSTNSAQANYSNREQTRLLVFIALFSLNLFGVMALLLAWNVKGISNQNMTWALLAICGMVGFSILCCIFYFFICFNDESCSNNNRSASMRRICCISPPQTMQKPTKSKKFFANAPFSLACLKNGFGRKSAKVYGVQTVFPTPEFQYFSNSPPPTVTNPMTIRPHLNRTMSSSKDSQLSGAAFSVVSTAPASSMLNVTDSLRHADNNLNTNNNKNNNDYLADTNTDSLYHANENTTTNSSNNCMEPRIRQILSNNHRDISEQAWPNTTTNLEFITSSPRIEKSSSYYAEFRPKQSPPTSILELLAADGNYSSEMAASEIFHSSQSPEGDWNQFRPHTTTNYSTIADNLPPPPSVSNVNYSHHSNPNFPFVNASIVMDDSNDNDEEIDFESVPSALPKVYGSHTSNEDSNNGYYEKITSTDNYAHELLKPPYFAENSLPAITTVNMYSSGP